MRGIDSEPIEGVPIVIKENAQYSTISNSKGEYSLSIESGKLLTLVFYDASYTSISHVFTAKLGEKLS